MRGAENDIRSLGRDIEHLAMVEDVVLFHPPLHPLNSRAGVMDIFVGVIVFL